MKYADIIEGWIGALHATMCRYYKLMLMWWGDYAYVQGVK